MGNEASSCHPGLSCTSDSSNVALVFDNDGIYGVQGDGGYKLVNKEKWMGPTLALPTREGDAITIFHQKMYHAPMAEVLEDKAVGYLPITVDGKVVLLPENEGMFRLDNSLLQHKAPGLGFRSSKEHPPVKWDTDTFPAPCWGSVVQGQDEGDGWIKVMLSQTRSKNISAIGKETWSSPVATVRCEDSTESLCVFQEQGIYKVHIADGKRTRLDNHTAQGTMDLSKKSTTCWGGLKAIVYNPSIPGYVFTFNPTGIFKVKLSDGTYEQVSSDLWARASAAVYDPDSDVALVFHKEGIYEVKLTDGTFTNLNKGNWTVCGAVNCGGGKALAFCPDGMYAINMMDGVGTKMNSKGFHHSATVCPLGPMAFTCHSPLLATPPPIPC